MPANPKISIITVVRNGEKYIENTIKSVICQNYINIEYIVIDGKSSDDTTLIIKKHDKNIDYWISESDTGIYDAMNKGVAASTGDWLLFINSDDFLVSDTIISEVVPYLISSKSWILYGQVLYINPSLSESPMGKEWENVKRDFRSIGMTIPHQGIFHSKRIFEHKTFDTSYKIAGDYDLLLSYLNKNDAEFIPIVISKMRSGGASYHTSLFSLLSEVLKAQKSNGIRYNYLSARWIYNISLSIFQYYFIRIFASRTRAMLRRLTSSR